MMWLWLLACGGKLALETPPVVPVTQTGVVDISDRLLPLRASHQVPALGGAVVSGDGLLALGAVGQRHLGASDPVTPDDAWHLGSDTKAMTAALLATYVEEGTLSWDTKLVEVFPEVEAHPSWAEITLLQLLQHRGGAPSNLPGDWTATWIELAGRGDEPVAARRWFVGKVLAHPTEAPGEFHYSNGGYMLVGAAIEAKTGGDWEQLMRDRLFGPLGMDSCGFGPPLEGPWGHAAKLVGDGLAPADPSGLADNPPPLGPAGTVHCSLADWGAFLSWELRLLQGEPRLVSEAQVGPLFEPVDDYAAGWGVTDRPWAKGRVFTHNGSNTMWMASAWMAPSVDRAYLAVTNTADAAATDATIGALVSWSEESSP